MDAFARTLAFLRDEVRPVAEIIDRDSEALRQVVKRMGELGLLALKRPIEYGGPEIPEEQFRQYQEEVARVSGTLAFLVTQHQSAVTMIAKSAGDAFKAATLPHMHDGTRLIGIGFSQLRRPGPPIMRATRVEGGYRLDGHVPWVTGWSFFPEFLIGAALPDGDAIFGAVPLSDQPGIRVSAPMELASLGAGLTVTVDLDGYLMPDAHVAFQKPRRWIERNDMINIALQGHFAMGCAQAGIDLLQATAERKGFDFLAEAASTLQAELDACRQATRDAQRSVDEETTDDRLRVRAWAIELSVRCAHSAVAACSGASNYAHHPAQRIYREALVFTVSAQTTDVMRATITRLAK